MLVSYGVEVFVFEAAMGVLGPYHVSYMLSVIFFLLPDEALELERGDICSRCGGVSV